MTPSLNPAHRYLIILALGLLGSMGGTSDAGAQTPPVSGLSTWRLYLDPGHSQRENMGIYNYSEAEKVLYVSNQMRELFRTYTDIDTVYASRTNGSQLVSLTQRTDHANSLGADWYHSIHSDAGPPSANSTLLLWGQGGNGVEKTPKGGQQMSAHMIEILTAGMRIGTRGSYGDCSFYRTCNPSSGSPYLSVNRRSTMASELSEAGFHTSPEQNPRNMNPEWKRLEAHALFWSILRYHKLSWPSPKIITGFVKDAELGTLINGAEVIGGGRTYVTDTWASRFSAYTTDPDLLSNGFYWLEDVAGDPVTVTYTAPGYHSETRQVTLDDDFFTFEDVTLLSKTPPTVAIEPAQGATHRVDDIIYLRFSRPMNRESVITGLQLEPAFDYTVLWVDQGRTLQIRPKGMLAQTSYTLTLPETVKGLAGDLLDGNSDGIGGDGLSLTFTTGSADVTAPNIATSIPSLYAQGIGLTAPISLVITEPVDPDQLGSLLKLSAPGQPDVPFTMQFVPGEEPIVVLHPTETLMPLTWYTATIDPGLQDGAGNVTTSVVGVSFRTTAADEQSQLIDPLDLSSASDWWAPQQSGSTTGIVTDSTARTFQQDHFIPTWGDGAMAVQYGFDQGTTLPLIRLYLGGGAPRATIFSRIGALSAWVLGDGSGTKLRFAVDDNYPATAGSNHEVSPWTVIDWKGWRRVSWDLVTGETGSWIGDGSLDGQLRFDSFQLSRSDGGQRFGEIVIDALSLVYPSTNTARDAAPIDGLPLGLAVYPNPVRSRLTIEVTGVTRFEGGTLSLIDMTGRTVWTTQHAPGDHPLISVQTTGLASGLYLVSYQSPTRTLRRPVTIIAP
ncbi:MAG: T9SS C-terminal target domain-containing protein [Bacteroidetes bacterium]|nr:T9SS C-terminal target domain-containing protein [Bacteroidota bacterium]